MIRRYFLDCEFIEDGRTIDLISIGVVCDDGREFYREVMPYLVPWNRANDWVRANVKPHLSGEPDIIRSLTEIAAELHDFVLEGGGKPEFWAYYGAYDWVVVAQLFGPMIALPKGWPMYCNDLKQLCVSRGDPRLPEQTSTEHHALADARWNRDVYLWLHAPTYVDGTPITPQTDDEALRPWEEPPEGIDA